MVLRAVRFLRAEIHDSDISMTLPEPTITQLMVARHLFYIAKQNIEASQALRLFAGINLLHDAVEAALWAAATYKNVGRDRSEILQLYDDVSKSLIPGADFWQIAG
jgi:hypothetical protein